MKDSLKKLGVYLKQQPDYWKLSDFRYEEGVVGVYPLSFKDRLFQGHYVHFDKSGIPMFHSKAGNLVYFCTGICSFAFANYEQFLLSGEDEYKNKVIQSADRLVEMIVDHDEVAMIYDYDDHELNNPVACAMNQGESISVMLRAHELSGNKKYLNYAKRLSEPFSNEYGKTGVITYIENDHIWFLEGGKKILNGHIYALIGLHELNCVSNSYELNHLVEGGLSSVIALLPRFDLGWWSRYWLDSPDYIASAMYHNLHICQLEILYQQHQIEAFRAYSIKFKKYHQSFVKRISAGLELVKSKRRLKNSMTSND